MYSTVVVFLCMVYFAAVIGKFELYTDNSVDYKFFRITNKSIPFKSGAIHFKVKTSNDAHIGLTREDLEIDPMIEIAIGGWANTNSVIRRRFKTLPEKVSVETHGILNRNEFRSFWVSWDNGFVSVGREGAEAPFMSWTDPNPYTFAFFGIHTGWGATGNWVIEDPSPNPVPVLLPSCAPRYLDSDRCCKCCNQELQPWFTTAPPAFTNAIPYRR